MRHALLYAVATIAMCLHTGCFEIIERLELNRDGSGHYSLIIKPDSGITALGAFARNLDSQIEEGDDYVPSSARYDSVRYYNDYPDSAKVAWKNAAIMSRAYRVSHVDDSEGEDWQEMHFDFEKPEEINDFLYNVMMSDQDMMMEVSNSDMLDDIDILWLPYNFKLEGNTLTRSVEDMTAFKQRTIRQQKMHIALAKKIEVSFEATLPGKVKSSDNEDFETKGKRAFIEANMGEILEEEITFSNVIKFK